MNLASSTPLAPFPLFRPFAMPPAARRKAGPRAAGGPAIEGVGGSQRSPPAPFPATEHVRARSGPGKARQRAAQSPAIGHSAASNPKPRAPANDQIPQSGSWHVFPCQRVSSEPRPRMCLRPRKRVPANHCHDLRFSITCQGRSIVQVYP